MSKVRRVSGAQKAVQIKPSSKKKNKAALILSTVKMLLDEKAPTLKDQNPKSIKWVNEFIKQPTQEKFDASPNYHSLVMKTVSKDEVLTDKIAPFYLNSNQVSDVKKHQYLLSLPGSKMQDLIKSNQVPDSVMRHIQ